MSRRTEYRSLTVDERPARLDRLSRERLAGLAGLAAKLPAELFVLRFGADQLGCIDVVRRLRDRNRRGSI